MRPIFALGFGVGMATGALIILLMILLTGCGPQGSCHPGDVKAAHGHVEKCGPDKKWHV